MNKQKHSFLVLMLSISSTAILFSCREQEKKPPNILFAISDDQSFPHASAYGCDWISTPGFDEVAEKGILFMNCYTPNAKCAPSRSCIITGRNSWQLEEAGNHVSIFPEKFTSVFETFGELTAYHIGFTGKGVEPVDPQGRLLTGKRYNDFTTNPPGAYISNTDYAENFRKFLQEKSPDSPFLFWYGGREPHRAYEFKIGTKKGGKDPEDIDRIPGYWPDTDTVRQDMLDYAFEIEYFDAHLQKMLRILEAEGELNNTIVFVTSDNGMPFPRCKGTEYEHSNHLPLAIMWPDGIRNPGRIVEDYVSFIDFAPTFLQIAGLKNDPSTGMQPIQGKSLMPLLLSPKQGMITEDRDHVLLGQERHDVGRPDDAGYPVRSVIKGGFLYIHNFKPDRWPMCNPETGYLNTDGGPTKSFILNQRRDNIETRFWDLCFAKRPSEELYFIESDPDCLVNLAEHADYSDRKNELKEFLFSQLKEQKDPRMTGNGDVFDHYLYAHKSTRDFYNKFMNGELGKSAPGWVNESDFEDQSLD